MMTESLFGKFLIAEKKLRDSNFYRTVVLIVEHGKGGAMGLVVNRPSSVTVAHYLSKHFNLPETDDVVFFGGPVEPEALFVLHSSSEHESGDCTVVPGLYVGSNREEFESVIRSAAANPDLRFRIFAGCAGWAPGQLENELARGDWHVQQATAELVLHDDPYEVWDLTLQKFYQTNRILPYSVDHPEWN